MSRNIPLYVFGGFLGAGKTTLINDILARGKLRAGVLVNDFGAVNIDAALIAGAHARVTRLANGCVCCSLGDDLLQALGEVVEAGGELDAIVIEASGVGDPWRIAEIAFLDPALALGAVFCAADATGVAAQMNDPRVGDIVRAQLAGADIVLLTKCDLADAPAREVAARAIRGLRPEARIVEIENGAAPVELMDAAHEDRPRARAAAGHESRFTRFLYEREGAFDRARLAAALAAAPPALLRLKGLCPLAAAPPALLQMVGARFALTRPPAAMLDAAPAGFIRLVGVFAGALHETATLERLLDGALSGEISAPFP